MEKYKILLSEQRSMFSTLVCRAPLPHGTLTLDNSHVALSSESQAQPYISALLASFDPIQAPVTRSQSSAIRKRKRSPSPPPATKDVFKRTPLTCLYVQGLDRDQIWAQLELRAQHVCKMLDCALDGTEDNTACAIPPMIDNMGDKSSEEGGSDLSSGESDGDSETSEEAGGFSDGELSEEGIAGLRDESADEEDEEGHSSLTLASRRRGARSGLDDGFFDLAEFNEETQEAEAGFVSNGALDADSDSIASDEDNIDYFAAIDGQLQDEYDHGNFVIRSVIGI
jgi:U3 small nucleolar RNA-associated protein MPP10